jgi:signal transduction histidine kinase/DNA-binding response OmpR family regulator
MSLEAETERARSPLETPFLQGGGELGALMRAHDWARTPLGPPEQWPQSLRSAVSILLPSKAQIVLFWGPELVSLYNDAYRPVFGAKHPGALGRPVREAWSEIWHTGLGDLFAGVLRTGEAFWAKDRPFILERHAYPEETFFDVSYDPVRDESGGVGGVFCIVSETTGRVLGERRLRTLRDLAARNADARSPREACLLGVDSLAGNPHDLPFVLLYLVRAEGQPPVLECGTAGSASLHDARLWPWEDALRANQMRVVRLDASARDVPAGAWPRPPAEAAVVPLGGSDPASPAGMLVLGLNPFRPIDEDYRGFLELVARQVAAGILKAQAYEDERRRAESLAQLDRAKTAFFSNVSHEFRTPLTLMLGPLEDTLAQGEDLSSRSRERLEVAHRNAQRLLKLVNTLLDFSRIEAGRLGAAYQPTELGTLTAELASVFRSAVERGGLRLVVDCPPLDQTVYVDREMWEKVVFNLLSNAFKFTFEGEIAVRLRRAGDQVALTVRDTGTGIPAEDLPHVFERFHRVKEARGRTFEGTGIGLALVQELVNLHGGTVAVESEVGRGSLFTVTLPLGRAHLPADRVVAPSALPTNPSRAEGYAQELLGWLPAAVPVDEDTSRGGRRDPAWPRPSRILLADDNADMRQYVRRLLSQRYEVEAVGDGRAALRAARERPPDLVLADVMMPELDGFALMRELRADPDLRNVPVILLSARAGEEERVEGIAAGAEDYLVKPFGARELLARVAARLDLSRLQAQLNRERAELADLFAQTPVPTAVLRGPDLVFEMLNPAGAEVLGRRNVIGRALLDVLPELQGRGFDDVLREVMRTGTPHVGREARLKLPRRGALEDTYWTFVYAPLRGPSGTVDGVIAICNEVTAEVRARQVIRESEERYRHIFHAAGVSIWEEDFSAVKLLLDGLKASGVEDLRRHLAEHPEVVRQAVGLVKVVDVNEATLRIFGARDKGELRESLAKVFLPETEAVFAEELLAVAEGRPLYAAETVVRTLTGERLDIMLTVAFPTADPSLSSVLVTVTDVTARKRAERSLREEARTLETLDLVGRTVAAQLDLESVVQAVTDAATEVSFAEFGAFFRNVKNDEGGSYLLYTLSGAPREAFAGFDAPRNTAIFAPTFAGEGPVRLDDVTRDPRYGHNAPHHGMPKGHLPVRSYLAVPVVSRSGEVLGGLFFGHSRAGVFTERAERLVTGIAAQAAVAIDNARLHEQRLQLIDQLREADRRKDEFLATLSHELRNPLAPLRNSLHLLRLAGHAGASATSIHQMMERQVQHLVRLVDDLLEMSRISRGTFELRKERVEVAGIVRNAVETSDPLLQAAGHQLTVSLPSEPLWVDGDPVRLAQILANLLNNAANYTTAGGEISVEARREGGVALLAVRDNGAGITAEALPRLFEMFSRGDRQSGHDQGGLGIGLALARRLAEMHGGTITARSEGPGLGSEFTVRLPLAADQRPLAASAATPTAAIQRRILVVDDNRDSAESMGMLLGFLGADVRVAFNGAQALEAYAAYDPAVVLLDIGMPGMDGYEVVRRLRADYPKRRAAIVALTGWGQEEDRRRAREAGFDHHLIKPADLDALQALLRSLEG